MATPQVPRVIKTDKPTARATQPSTQYPWQQPGFTPRPPTRQQVPNYERLTATERWVMNRLPGIAESGVGRALEPSAERFWEVSVGPLGRSRAVFLERALGRALASPFRWGKMVMRAWPPSLSLDDKLPILFGKAWTLAMP